MSTCNPSKALQPPSRHDSSHPLYINHIQNPYFNSCSSSPPACVSPANLRGGLKLASWELLGEDTPGMGPCVLVRKEPEPAMPRLAMGTDAGEVLAAGFDPNSMPEEAGLGFRSPRFGTQDETFFDSQEWFESDCEDDFFSVNGDCTPSHGSTPNYQTGTPIKLQLSKAALTLDGLSEAKCEPSPRKTLAELLQETLPGELAGKEHNTVVGNIVVNEKSESNKTIMDQLPNSLDGTPYLSTTTSVSGERNPDGKLRNRKGKRGKAKQCCLPSLVHSLSFHEKKWTLSPRRQSGG